MALSPQEIYDLDKEIFNFLYNKHLEAKVKGEDFYFHIEPHKGNIEKGEIETNLYWFNIIEKYIIPIFFWEDPNIGFVLYKSDSNNYNARGIINTNLSYIDESQPIYYTIYELGKALQSKDNNWIQTKGDTLFFIKDYP